MRPTNVVNLVAAAIICGVLSFLACHFWYDSIPQLGFWVPVILGLLGIAELVSAPLVKARLSRRPGTMPIAPLIVVRFVVLAKASSVAGAVLAGVWGGMLVEVVPRASAPRPHDLMVLGIVGVVCNILLVAGGLWLEYVCRVKVPKDGDPPGAVRG